MRGLSNVSFILLDEAEKKTKLGFIHRFIPLKSEGGGAATRTSRRETEGKALQLFFYFMVLEEMKKI
jgi:hypothetical protein